MAPQNPSRQDAIIRARPARAWQIILPGETVVSIRFRTGFHVMRTLVRSGVNRQSVNCSRTGNMLCKYCSGTTRLFGRNRGGNQRYHCNICHRTMSEAVCNDMRRTRPELVEKIKAELINGKSLRQIYKETGVHKKTIATIKSRMCPPPTKKTPQKIGPTDCDNCGETITTTREFFRRTRRTRHKFCSSDCYRDFYRKRKMKANPLLEIAELTSKLRETIHDREQHHQHGRPAQDAH